jgi:hypothetical protein
LASSLDWVGASSWREALEAWVCLRVRERWGEGANQADGFVDIFVAHSVRESQSSESLAQSQDGQQLTGGHDGLVIDGEARARGALAVVLSPVNDEWSTRGKRGD